MPVVKGKFARFFRENNFPSLAEASMKRAKEATEANFNESLTPDLFLKEGSRYRKLSLAELVALTAMRLQTSGRSKVALQLALALPGISEEE